MSWNELAQLLGLTGAGSNFPTRYNVAPTQDVSAIIAGAKGNELASFRWGLVPSWSKDGLRSKPLINARGESVSEKPSFRDAYLHRRCLLPADGFYEWQRPDNGPKVPYNICLNDGGPFLMAGIWDVWRGPDGTAHSTCAIVTTAANEVLRSIHHRMPVILAPEDWQTWLTTSAADVESLKALIRPAPAKLLRAYEVSTRVNRVANDGPENITPAASESELPKKAPENDSKQGNLF